MSIFCRVLQPHGRDEHLISRKMWKHIFIQGLYQMFWLFFFMYGFPILFERYRITDSCTYVSTGPDEWDPNPIYCSSKLQSELGYDQARASFYCGAMTGCGFAFGCNDARRQTASCPFSGRMPAGQQVPGDAAAAFAAAFPDANNCPGFTTCPNINEYNSAVTHMDKAYIHEAEVDWEKADSLLFNSFIFLQLLNEVNSRRINDELNVFEGIHRSPIFLGVLAVTAGLQVGQWSVVFRAAASICSIDHACLWLSGVAFAAAAIIYKSWHVAGTPVCAISSSCSGWFDAATKCPAGEYVACTTLLCAQAYILLVRLACRSS